MRFFILIVFSTIVFSCSSFLSRQPSSSVQKPRHIVITVHGLTGNQDTFGSFNEATQQYLQAVNPTHSVEVYNFIYPTGRSEQMGSTDFAFSPEFGLSRFINDKVGQNALGPQDKISFVCHSQGGIVTYMWYFSALLQQSSDMKYVQKVETIITLGTPFWGSKIASILTDKNIPDLIPFIKLFAPDDMKVTRREIADMAFASDTIHTFRTLAVKMDSDPQLAKTIAALPVRMVNITGILPQDKNDLFVTNNINNISDVTRKIINYVYKIFTKSYQGNKRIESDIAVPVTSSRWNFIYSPSVLVTGDTQVKPDSYRDFQNMVSRSKFLYTESAHLPFETQNTFSMAYIGKNCLSVESCNHPTYRYILEQLADCKESICDKTAFENIIQKMKAVNLQDHQSFKQIRDSLQSFAIQIDMKLAPGSIDQFPVQYYRQKGNMEEMSGYEAWEFNEQSLPGKVINFMKDKKSHVSQGSPSDARLILGDNKEKHSVDIVARRATKEDPFDRIRLNVFGRVESNSYDPNRKFTIPLQINLPYLPKVKLEATVKPTYSTFTELDYSQVQMKKD